ncbi:aldehyde dehydrogenase [Francisella tularensis subsp. novicida]|uniref:aldehyde dehydrogenase family protein n=1 Tax=Francisella tularensis TaxID=263 RepID=UPI000CE298C7|nr:aldehyde dehydrogenase family protein [Francisella tularensis]AVC44757.1 aldehyde dehydrogenase [Francisella tularensis subsp. novicida]
MKKFSSFVGNNFVKSEYKFEVLDKNKGKPIYLVDAVRQEDISSIVDKAAKAQKIWAKTSCVKRGSLLKKVAQKITEKSAEIGKILADETGSKSVSDATNEAVYAAQITDFHAEWARRIEGEYIPSDIPDEQLIMMREPIGVAVCIIPFNFPIYTLMRKVAPALITGNTVVVKVSNSTPCSSMVLAECFKEVGFPEYVVNIMAMDIPTTKVMCEHPAVGIVSLTGSVAVGRAILEYSKINMAKVSLELGGKTPVIVNHDADLDKVVEGIVGSRLSNSGQLCTAAERVYVVESLHDELTAKIKDKFSAIKLGDRRVNEANFGPLISKDAQQNTHKKVEKAIKEGATLEVGGFIPKMDGYFYPPTLLSGCKQNMEIIREESFAPILPIVKVKDMAEALKLANDHKYGLASVLFTNCYKTIMQFSQNIEAGELYINRMPGEPYQGYHAGWKQSGIGGDDGKHGMLEFTQTRLVIMGN